MKEFNVEYADEQNIVARNREQMLDLYNVAVNNEDCILNYVTEETIVSKILIGEAFAIALSSGIIVLSTSQNLEQAREKAKAKIVNLVQNVGRVMSRIDEEYKKEEEKESKKSKSSKKKGRGRPKKEVKRGRGRPKKQ
jgi:hypothetical protein